MLFGVLKLMGLWLLRKDLLRPFLWIWHGKSLSEVITISMAAPLITLINIIVKCRSSGLGAITKLPNNAIADIFNFGDCFKVVSLSIKEGFCAPIVHSNLEDDLRPFGLRFSLKIATHKVIVLLNKFICIFVEPGLDQFLKNWKGMYHCEFTPKEPLIRYNVS